MPVFANARWRVRRGTFGEGTGASAFRDNRRISSDASERNRRVQTRNAGRAEAHAPTSKRCTRDNQQDALTRINRERVATSGARKL